MKDLFQTFFNKWLNKPCEVNDPSNLNQCFDLAYAWCDALSVPRNAIRHLYASEIYTKPNDLTVKYFELIPNTALAVPQVGDIVVFKGGTAGHVSISNGVGDTNSFQTFDQNFGTTVGKCGIITHPYDNVLGFLRYRVVADPVTALITDQTRIPQIDNMEVQQIRSIINDQKKDVQSLTSRLEASQNALQGVTDTNSKLSMQINESTKVVWGRGWVWVRMNQLKKLLPNV
jgi:surface antigen